MRQTSHTNIFCITKLDIKSFDEGLTEVYHEVLEQLERHNGVPYGGRVGLIADLRWKH